MHVTTQGHVGAPGLVDYCASKFAAVGLDESLRFEFKKLGKTGKLTLLVFDLAKPEHGTHVTNGGHNCWQEQSTQNKRKFAV